MHPKNRDRGLRIGVLVLLGLLVVGSTAAVAQEPAPPPRPEPRGGQNPTILLPIGGSQQISMTTKKPIANVFLTGEGVIRVVAGPKNDYIVVSGLSAGTVGLKLTDVDGKEEWYDVVVQLDTAYIKQIIRQTVPTSNIEVIAALNRTIIITGWVARGEDIDTVMRVAAGIIGAVGSGGGSAPTGGAPAPTGTGSIVNAIRVSGPQQVQLDVTVASVNRSQARKRGFNWAYNGSTVSLGSILGNLTTVGGGGGGAAGGGGAGAGLSIPGVTATPTGAANLVFGVIPANFQALLQLLKDEQLANVLAEPKVVAMSGRTARLLSGGRQAVQGGTGGLGGVSVNLEPVGTTLDVMPIVLGNGRIYLELTPQFRAVNFARGITANGALTPGFDEQSVHTAVELESGQTFAIGGLIQTTVQASSTRVPVIGALPYVGTLFSQVQHQMTEEELVILVTPHLVDAQDCQQLTKRLPGRETRTPDDYELFLEGILEAPRGQRQVFEDGKYKAAYKNDPTLRQYPCADPLPWERKLGNRAGGNCASGNCASGNCAAGGTPGRLPAGVQNEPPVVPAPANLGGDPNLKVAPDREQLPAPNPFQSGPAVKFGPTSNRTGSPLPEMPAAPGREEPPRN